MGMFRVLAGVLLLVVACEGQISRLTAGSSISGNQTLISEGEGDFALGFFTPNNSSSNRYLGIWDNKIPGKSVVWVANRETAVKDTINGAGAAAATITEEGNLAVSDANGTVVWSSGLAPSNATTYAVLSDTGNLVLKRAAAASRGADTVVWQSFDHPGDTWLPNMNMWLDTKNGESARLFSWRSELDPSPGNFSLGIDPKSKLQYKIWRQGLETWVRSDVWNGLPITADRQNMTDAVVVQTIDFTDGRLLSYSFSLTKGSPPARVKLSPSGVPINLFWQPSINKWFQVPRLSQDCSLYNRCGHNAVCVDSVTATANQPYCQCLKGFVPEAPQEWDRGNHSRGCTRRLQLSCNKSEDGFLRKENMKLPDGFRLVVNANEESCLEECQRNCSCTAYSFSNASVRLSNSRCLVWAGDLDDLNQKSDSTSLVFAASSSNLYIRVDASELDIQKTKASSSKRRTALAIVVPLAVIGLVISGALVCIRARRLRERKEMFPLDEFKLPNIMEDVENPTMLKILDFSCLQAATNNFSIENRLGEGGFGPVYKGLLHGGEEVAIKRLSKCSGQGLQEFRNEVEVIARLQHTNLVRLLGWCVHENEKILVYEYMPNNSLEKFLFDPTRKVELTWPRRFTIIQGIAQGLLYLHRYSRLRIIHRDMKTSNILLDDEMNPKISDFGLARIIGKTQAEGNTNRVVGTIGYMSPEYAFDGLFSEKSDVFAFGVIILEIVTGKRSTGCYLYKESLNLLGYVWGHWKEEKVIDLVDSSLSNISVEDVTKCIQIGLLCTQEKAFDRPTMTSVISMLDANNATLPSPNQPAFSTIRYADVMDPYSLGAILYSLNASMTSSVMTGEKNVIS